LEVNSEKTNYAINALMERKRKEKYAESVQIISMDISFFKQKQEYQPQDSFRKGGYNMRLA